jgi:SNF2 family DNA or RNA helicase
MSAVTLAPSGHLLSPKSPALKSGQILFALAISPPVAADKPDAAYWQGFARSYFEELVHHPSANELASVPPPMDMPVRLEGAPPLTGGEYLSVDVLCNLWRDLDVEVFRRIADSKLGPVAWALTQKGSWNPAGQITLHLAENKEDESRPFAFMASFGLQSGAGKTRFRPLARALQDFEGNPSALADLLRPLHQAAEKSALLRELISSKRVYHPQAWTAPQALRLLKDLAVIEAAGLQVRIPNWWKRSGSPRVKVNVSIGARKPSALGLDAILSFSANFAIDGESLSEEEMEALLKNAGGLVRIKGQWVEVDPEKLKALMAHWKAIEARRKEGGLSFSEAMRLLSGADTPELGNALPPEDVRAWTGLQAGPWLEEILAGLRHPDARGGHPDLRGTLRPYQEIGAGWLGFTSGLGLGACLADDMGLGKTIQTLSALLHIRQAGPSLLIAPASLLGNWKAEAAKFAPSLRLLIAHPSQLDVDEMKTLSTDPAAIQGYDLVLTTYGMAMRQKWVAERKWNALILDEAQTIKNPAAKQTLAIKKLTAQRRIALTGTPVENSLGDLWSIFDFLNPGLLGTVGNFAKTVGRLQKAGSLAPLRRLVAPYILRRLKTDKTIIADLPDKSELTARCSLTREQAALYDVAVRELATKLETLKGIERRGLILAYLTRFKQICNHPAHWLGHGDFAQEGSGKFQRLIEIAETVAARQEKMLVFSQYQEMTRPLHDLLAKIFGRPGLILHGGTRISSRPMMVNQFAEESGPPFFVLSLKAGGTGLNLTAACHVVHFDRWWNPAVETQASDRAYRIGQKRNVLIHKFVCTGTLEERIDALLESKRSLAGEMLSGGGELSLTEMKNEDILRLVSLDLRTAVPEGGPR